ncbi:hypothetical protein Egran_00839 [Elaphomyces granulatus]|uniref:Uncharacterized protein n=1 Tax=Elaphomyces granulatus TaxID=519963 RepID=A0A232M5N2_9EURO|nr:hypothetical protein Egran_00839 [Elaphomyces granulatus]
MTTAPFAITRGLRPISWWSSPFLIRSSTSTSTVRHPTSPQSDEEQLRAAREWLANLDSKTIPRRVGAVSFSRSSGPGGQNVNKSVASPNQSSSDWNSELTLASHLSVSYLYYRVNTKATIKVPFSALLPLVPPILHPRLRASRYAAERSDALVIQSDESRRQSNNVDTCFEKLHQLLEVTAKTVIPGETSWGKRERVQKLQRVQKEVRLRTKKIHSSKKSSRRGSKYDDQ